MTNPCNHRLARRKGPTTTRFETTLRKEIAKGPKRCKYYGGTHEVRRGKCPAYGKTCGKCGRSNHFVKFCMQRGRRKNPAVNISDSGESLFTVLLSPEIDSVYAIQRNVQLYNRSRRHLERSAEAYNPVTEEWPTPSNDDDSKFEVTSPTTSRQWRLQG